MSYILDALRKSDEERKKRQEQQQRPYSPYAGAGSPTRKNRRTAGLILSASLFVVICLLAGGWWLSEQQQQSKPFEPEQATPATPRQTRPQPAQEIQEGRARANPAANELTPPLQPGLSEIDKQRRSAAEAVKAKTAQSDETARSIIPLMAELPFSIQAQLPELKFSGHAYSTAPELRLIMINNAVVREGELIDTDLYLEEITENGLIMNYRGTRFSIELF